VAVLKFRSIAEMPPPGVAGSPAENLRAALELSNVCLRLGRVVPYRGVRRFRGVGAAATSAVTPERPDRAS
jgi:hypothetical protein